MQRIACVNLPEFPLQLLFRQHPDWQYLPTVVVDRDAAQGTVLWSNDAARRLRVLPGIRYAAGLSLSPQLRAGVVGESDTADAVAAVMETLRFYAPGVEPSPAEAGVFWLDASGLSLLYPSLERWAALITGDLRSRGFEASIAVGFTRFGSYAVARTAPGRALFDTPESEREAAGCVPLERLGIDPRLRDSLGKLGITTVGGFLELPANGVKKRFGAEVFDLHRLARDELFAPLQPQAPREPVLASVLLDHPETSIDRLMVLIDRELQALLIKLSEGCEVLSAVVVRLSFDDGGPAVTERLQPASPTLELEQILDLVGLRLGGVMAERAAAAREREGRTHNGVTGVDVEVVGTPALAHQGELFVETSPRDLAAVARALARVRAEFGDDSVVRAVLRDGHLPEARFEWVPVGALGVPRARAVHQPPLVRRFYPRPVLFSPGLSRDADRALVAHIDDGSVRETLGPYVVSGGWWNREVHREYYFVRTANGRSLWMYYDRRRQCWFIHGEVE